LTTLFRPEVIEGQQQSWLGGIQLMRPVSLFFLTGFTVLVVVLVSTCLTLGHYTRKAHITGVLVPDSGVLRLLAPQAGTVLESHAMEGRTVKKGDVLFVLGVGHSSGLGDTQAAVQASLAARERSLEDAMRQKTVLQDAQRAGLDRQIDALRQELGQIDAETGLQQQRLALVQQAVVRLQSLQAENFISGAQVQAKQEELLGLRAEIQSLARERAGKQREMGALEAQRNELPLLTQAQQGELDRDRAELAQASAEAAARQQVVVRAPQDGVVTAVMAQVGQSAPASAALASLLPTDATLQAQLYAPSSAVGFVRPDQSVLLRYQAFPYQKFGHHAGRVLQVSRTPLPAAEVAGLALGEAANEPLYRITVALDAQTVQAYGRAQPLSPGMQIDADVLLEQRRLIEWIFEPLISVAGRV
jgi:membrane fusion protein